MLSDFGLWTKCEPATTGENGIRITKYSHGFGPFWTVFSAKFPKIRLIHAKKAVQVEQISQHLSLSSFVQSPTFQIGRFNFFLAW
jgi:hypothetical protein